MLEVYTSIALLNAIQFSVFARNKLKMYSNSRYTLWDVCKISNHRRTNYYYLFKANCACSFKNYNNEFDKSISLMHIEKN